LALAPIGRKGERIRRDRSVASDPWGGPTRRALFVKTARTVKQPTNSPQQTPPRELLTDVYIPLAP